MVIHFIELFKKNFIDPGSYSFLGIRSFSGLLTSLSISILLGPKFILFLKKIQFEQVIRLDGPKSHLDKKNVPTMGGVMILSSILFSIFLWADLTSSYVWYIIFILIGYGTIGFFDDYRKIIKKSSIGMSCKWKYFWQSLVALLLIFFLFLLEIRGKIQLFFIVPFFKSLILQLNVYWYIFIIYLIIVGIGNSVNFTDGLDGLAIVPTISIMFCLAFIAMLSSNESLSKILNLPYLRGSGELVVVCFSIIGAGLGFLWFNSYPAQIFMGDVGSLSLGGAIGVLSVLLKQELLSIIMNGLFFLEMISVVVQVCSFKVRKKRIFKMAPIHHHYELLGFPETKITVRFWIISFIFSLFSIIILMINR